MEIQDRSTKITSFTAPHNWERVLGHKSLSKYGAFYLLDPGRLFWTDGNNTAVSQASGLFTKFIKTNNDNIVGALNALGVPEEPFPFGDTNRPATHCILIDTTDHTAWTTSIVDALLFLGQFPRADIIEFPSPPRGTLTIPCTCTFGWKQDPETMDFFVCDQCKGSRLRILQEDF